MVIMFEDFPRHIYSPVESMQAVFEFRLYLLYKISKYIERPL